MYNSTRFSREPSRKLNLSKWPTLTVTLLVCLICWALGYYYSLGYPLEAKANTTLPWRYLCARQTDGTVIYLIGILVLLYTAILLQRANYHMVFIRQSTNLPFLIFFLLGSTNMDLMPIYPASIAMLFLIFALFDLFKSGQRMESGRAFNAAVLIGVGSLLWVHVLWFLPLYWYGMYKFKLLYSKTFLSSLLGVATIYWCILGWCVWRHDFTLLSDLFRQLAAIDVSFPQNILNNIRWLSVLGAFGLLLISFVYIRLHESESSLRTRQTLSFMLVFAVYTFVLLFLYNRLYFSGFLYFFYLPLTMLFAYMFSNKHGIVMFLLYYGILVFLFLLTLAQIWLL
jgi:hypothetical protein